MHKRKGVLLPFNHSPKPPTELPPNPVPPPCEKCGAKFGDLKHFCRECAPYMYIKL